MNSIFINIRYNANATVNKLVSPEGVYKNLQERLRQNEQFRTHIFRGRFSEEFTDDRLKAARDRIKQSYEAGLM